MAGSHIALTDLAVYKKRLRHCAGAGDEETTERPEAVEGNQELVGKEGENCSGRETATCPKDYERMVNALNPYGDGRLPENSRYPALLFW